MLSKLTSRKFWAMIGGVLIALFGGDVVDKGQLAYLIPTIIAWILGESYVDGKRASNPK